MPASPEVAVQLFPQDTTADGNKILDLTLASQIEFSEGERQTGQMQFSLPAGHAETVAAAVDAPRVARFLIDGAITAEFSILRLTRNLSDEEGGLVVLSGEGIRHTLSAGVVYPYGDCIPTEEPTQRILGYQDPSFDISGLSRVEEYGTFRSQRNFFTADDEVRAEGIADPFAAFITNETGAADIGEVLYFSPWFTVDQDGTYIMQVAADDEYDSFLVGALIGSARGKYQWKEVDNYLVNLCTGIQYRWVLRGNNLSTQYDGTDMNKHWVIGAIVEDSGEGTPAASNEIWHIATDAESGSFDVGPIISATTVTINFDDSASDVQAKLESIPEIGPGSVDVSGQGTIAKNDTYDWWVDAAGGTYDITVDGESATVAWNASAATITAAVEALPTVNDVTVTGSGTESDQFRMAFVGVDAESSFSVSFNGGSLSGGTNNEVVDTQVSEGDPLDPWVIEFVGVLGFANIGDPIVSNNNLVGGNLIATSVQAGSTAQSVIRTDTDWVHLPFPETMRGLTAGHMIRVVIEEAQARGNTVLDLYTLDFTDLVDSNGDPWETEYELAITPYVTSISDVVEFLELSGLKVRVGPGYVLEVSQTTGFNRTATVDLSTAHLGAETTFAVDKEIANVLLSETNEGNWIATVDSPSIGINGRWEEPYSAPEGPEVTVGSWQELAIENSKDPYKEHRLVTVPEDHPDGTADPVPFDDYTWGDGITGQDINGQAVSCYVASVGLRVNDENNSVEYLTTVVEGDVSDLPVATETPDEPPADALAFWVRADGTTYSDGDQVATWVNEGTLGTSYDMLAYGAGSGPTLAAGELNGLPVVRYDGVADGSLNRDGTSPVIDGAHTCYMLYRKRTVWGDNLQALRGRTTADLDHGGIYNGTPVVSDGSSNLGVGGNDTDWHLFSFVAGSGLIARRDGAQVNSTDSRSDVEIQGLTLGYNSVGGGGNSSWADIDIAEVLIYEAVHDADQVAEVEAYLTSKWGL